MIVNVENMKITHNRYDIYELLVSLPIGYKYDNGIL